MCWRYVVVTLLTFVSTVWTISLHCNGDISNCELQDVRTNTNDEIDFPAAFDRDLAQQVTSIEFKRSNFPIIPSNLFEVMPNLESLTARYCRIVSLNTFGPNSAYNVEGIKVLRLQGNQLVTLEGYTFSRTNKLTELVLARNRLTSIDALAFYGLSDLHVLDVSFNQLNQLEPEAFTPLRSLRSLYLLGNHFQVFNLDIFHNNGELMYINLMDSKLTTLLATRVNNVINHIDLRANQLVDISALGKMKRLDILQLSDNKNVDLSPSTFSEMGQLLQLRLNGVNLQRRLNNDFGFLTPLHELRVLFIGRNELTSLSSLPNLPMLISLLVNDNEFSTLDVNALRAQIPKLTEINIQNNRWDCQVLKNVVGQLKSSRIKLTFNNGEGPQRPTVNGTNEEGVGCVNEDSFAFPDNGGVPNDYTINKSPAANFERKTTKIPTVPTKAYTSTRTSTIPTSTYANPSGNKQEFIEGSKKRVPDNLVCGRPTQQFRQFIYGGQSTLRGAWPWLVAIQKQSGLSVKFLCGGSLISNKLVISAAHCLTELTISQTLLYIGSHDITSVTDTDFQRRGAQQLIPHPDYFRPNKTYSDADIGLIILNLPVIYTEYIKPICLWPADQNGQSIVAKRGVVAGWGRDESGMSVATPSVIEMPVVSMLDCLTEDPLSFLKLTSNRTLCVGDKDGKGPCHGGSGSGFVMKMNGRWVLRGIISAGLVDPVKQTCDLTKYVVLADAVKFMDWILSYLNL